VMPKVLSSLFGGVVDLGQPSFEQVFLTKLNDIPRSTLLCLHGFGFGIHYEFHQHSGRDQWPRSITNYSDLCICNLERPSVSAMAIYLAAWEVSSLGVLWCSPGRGATPDQPLLHDPSIFCIFGIRVSQLVGHPPVMPGSHLRLCRYPARAFPGDTFCYFSGMAFAVVAILGHFSKTLMLFFLPQIFNFVLSTPQLFRLIHCPRHRVPKLREDGRIEASVVLIENPNALTLAVVRLLSTVKLAQVGIDEETKSMTCTNLTILNFLLNFTGPIKEDTLTKLVIIVQLAGSVLAFSIRYGLAGFFYEGGDRR
jgi:hypothetical protein